MDTRSDHNGSGGAVGIVSLFYCNICKKHQNDQSDTRSDQQNEENTDSESRGAEGITHDVVRNEARVTAPEMNQNQAYAGGLTGQK